MKYVAALGVGFLAGVLGFFVLMYSNPFNAKQIISPLAVTDQPVISLQYSAVPEDAILYTNNGEETAKPQPSSVLELWEDTIKETRILVVALSDSRGESAGIGIKFSSDSEETQLLRSRIMVDSAWHIYLPDLGTVFVEQRENYWTYLRDIVVKAKLNSADSWRGNWLGVMTTGPNALGTGRAYGGNGLLANIESEAVESLSATAYSAKSGPVAMDGRLTVSLPDISQARFTESD